MLAAILHGKIPREVEDSEDLLTSVVFGALERLPLHLGFRKLLALARGPQKPACWAEVVRVKVEYWPWCGESDAFGGAEPDVVLTLEAPGHAKQVVVIEAKRGSGKSGHGDRDQLAREIDTAVVPHGAELGGLIYITADHTEPTDDLNASRAALARSRLRSGTPLWWLPWQDLVPVLCAAHAADPSGAGTLARDAARCLQRWGIEWFSGIDAVKAVPAFRFHQTFSFGPLRTLPEYNFRTEVDDPIRH